MSNGTPIPILNFGNILGIEVKAINKILDKAGDLPVAIYSINGKKRTGKSFMLGYFLKYLESNEKSGDWMNLKNNSSGKFEWRGGATRHTIGIDVWSEPIIIKNNGRDIAVILMDTQGSFDDVTTFQDNAIIFAVSTLLSSVLIFNVMNDIAEDTLQLLQYFTSYAALANGKKDSFGDAAEPFQRLVFLLRDFAHPIDYKYGYYDNRTMPLKQTKNYKVEALDTKSTQPSDVQFTHEQILKNFRDVGIFLMPEPEKGLRRFDKVNEMGDEFAGYAKQFVELMVSPGHIMTKTVGGLEVTGKDLKVYVEKWADMFQNGALPQIENLYNTTVKAQYQMAKRTAIDYFHTQMKKFIENSPEGVSQEALALEMRSVVDEGEAVYRSRSNMCGDNFYDQFKEEFGNEIKTECEIFKKMNKSNLEKIELKKTFDKQVENFTKKIERTNKSMADMTAAHEKDRQHLKEQIENGKANQADLKTMLEAQERDKENMNEMMRDNVERMENMQREHARDIERMESQILEAREAARPLPLCIVM